MCSSGHGRIRCLPGLGLYAAHRLVLVSSRTRATTAADRKSGARGFIPDAQLGGTALADCSDQDRHTSWSARRPGNGRIGTALVPASDHTENTAAFLSLASLWLSFLVSV